jgi:hypothetical protein
VRFPVAEMHDTREPLHVLHIGKTGGTALNHVLVRYAEASRYRPVFGGHELTLRDVPRGERFMFFIRDPAGRFVSAFNSRLREGRPRYHYPWRPEERRAFAQFKAPDELAVALSGRRGVRREAEAAMKAIGHLNTHYSFWLGDADTLCSRFDDVFFIGFQEQLDDDFADLKLRLGLPADAELPRGDVAHRAPAGFTTHLSDLARANLERWYAEDLTLVELCKEIAPGVNARPHDVVSS